MILENGYEIKSETIKDCLTQRIESDEPNYRDLNFREAKKIFEKAYFFQILEKAEGNISKASAFAGLDRGYFRDKLKSFGYKNGK